MFSLLMFVELGELWSVDLLLLGFQLGCDHTLIYKHSFKALAK